MSYSASYNSSTTQSSNEISLPLIARQAIAMLRGRRAQIRAKNQLRWELSQYSDRDLADLGLCRGDIEDVVQNRFAR